MTRAEFMQRLAELLSDVAPAEREEAIQYYNDYFDDAGKEQEQEVLASLGTPEAVARTLKTGLADSEGAGEFTEKGFQSYDNRHTNEVMKPQEYAATQGDNAEKSGAENAYGNYENPYQKQQSEIDKAEKKKLSAGLILLLVILGLLASPFLIGLAAGMFGLFVGILCAVIGIVVGFGAAAGALLAVGICLFVYGMTLLASIPLGGLSMMGAAMVCAAVGLLLLWITVMLCRLLPVIIRGIVKICQKILHRGGKKA